MKKQIRSICFSLLLPSVAACGTIQSTPEPVFISKAQCRKAVCRPIQNTPMPEKRLAAIDTLCIIKKEIRHFGSDVDFFTVLQQRVQHHGIKTIVIEEGDDSACRYKLDYQVDDIPKYLCQKSDDNKPMCESRLADNEGTANLTYHTKGMLRYDTAVYIINSMVDTLLNKKISADNEPAETVIETDVISE
ncbi:hypothetical protein [Stenoxybacter acetivorans]|uniref:hypothetical protein n=1 Tax=Stenoxybacter acetivorans TaxID=422441 RepID=UPI0012EB585E|nr:hypothetical protein [Stenoxybacter acetivorans]